MILERGDMWSIFGVTDWFLITTNPCVRKDGRAVMGRGIAKQAADMFPGLAEKFGSILPNLDPWEHPVFTIKTVGYHFGLGVMDCKIGCFMVKDHWKNQARLDIIQNSCIRLTEILDTITRVYGEPIRVDLNFPGIGNGGLSRDDVLPIIEQLPDNVHIWEKD